MTLSVPELTQFRIEPQANGIVHFVFDCPDRTMNVFSNKAIHELAAFAEWLHRAEDVRGVLMRSGKANGFCAGADLIELGAAYDMIVAAPKADRFDLAFEHFFALSHAIRRLETAGKPVAAAIAGVALGGGCELALGAHYRVLTDSKRAMMGLPEYAVGLLPGAGGTQRMPRLVGLELGLEVLLQGRTFQGQAAIDAGLAQRVVAEGEEVAAAEEWLLSAAAHAVQPWDRPDYVPLAPADFLPALEQHRTRELERMLGHEPAPEAILNCVAFGLGQRFDGAIRAETAQFTWLIQRAEPRNQIRTMFLGKQAYDKAARDGGPSETVTAAAAVLADAVTAAIAATPELRRAGLGSGESMGVTQERIGEDFWFRSDAVLAGAVAALGAKTAAITAPLSAGEQLQLDHAVVRAGTVPAYLGGATGLAAFAA
ncbi:MAG: enoyl-CoA hydratase-related protein [Pseudomonadota bacterium]